MGTSTPDCVVVGGGVIGLATALELGRNGVRVRVVERDVRARGASWAGAGILAPLSPWSYPETVSQLAEKGRKLYPEWIGRIESLSGIDCEYRTSGMLVLPCEDDKALAWMQKHGLPYVSGNSAAYEPDLVPHEDCIYMEDACQVRNPRLLAALRIAAAKLSVSLTNNTEIVSIESRGRKVIALTTGQGEHISARAFVVCAGAWTSRLLGKESTPLPLRPIRGQMLLYKMPAGKRLSHIVLKNDLYIVPRVDGHVLVGTTMEDSGYDVSVTSEARELLVQQVTRLYSPFGDIDPLGFWAGLRPCTPDTHPIIDRHLDYDNLYVHSGHFRSGLTMAPASAAIMCRLLENPEDKSGEPYRISRFVQNTSDELHPRHTGICDGRQGAGRMPPLPQ